MPAPDLDRVGTADWLCSPAGAQAREMAARVRDEASGDTLRAGTRLREAGLTVAHAAAALDQAALQQRAQERGMAPDPGMLLTRDGLEAATGPAVARHRAELVRAAGARRVLDLTGGLGFDSRAFLAAGLEVTCIERDPVTARYLAHNCPAATVVRADATDPGVLTGLLGDLDPADVVFVDPARRDPGAARDASTARARPERDPERWSPPWSWVAAVPHLRIAVKSAPGFRPPDGWQAQWVSVDRTVVECSAYSWDATGHVRSAAIITRGSVVGVVAPAAPAASVAERLGGWIHEVDPAVLRAEGGASLAAELGLRPLDSGTSWLTGDADVRHPALRSFRVLADLQGPPRDRRRHLASLGVTRASVKCRDVAAEPGRVLRDLGLREGTGEVIVVTRLAGATRTLLAEPLPAAGGGYGAGDGDG